MANKWMTRGLVLGLILALGLCLGLWIQYEELIEDKGALEDREAALDQANQVLEDALHQSHKEADDLRGLLDQTNENLKGHQAYVGRLEDKVKDQEAKVFELYDERLDTYLRQKALLLSQVKLVDRTDRLAIESSTADYEDYTFMYLDPDQDREASLEKIIQALTTYYFVDLDMAVMEVDQDQVVHVNIIEDQETDVTWHHYFSGSTGGYITDLTMVEAFLQRAYEGLWFKGVKFYFNGQADVELDHVGMFMGTYYRDKDYFTWDPVE